jgi:hypothetical protein
VSWLLDVTTILGKMADDIGGERGYKLGSSSTIGESTVIASSFSTSMETSGMLGKMVGDSVKSTMSDWACTTLDGPSDCIDNAALDSEVPGGLILSIFVKEAWASPIIMSEAIGLAAYCSSVDVSI